MAALECPHCKAKVPSKGHMTVYPCPTRVVAPKKLKPVPLVRNGQEVTLPEIVKEKAVTLPKKKKGGVTKDSKGGVTKEARWRAKNPEKVKADNLERQKRHRAKA